MRIAHRLIGAIIIGGFLFLLGWGLVIWIRRRPPSPGFWRLLGVLQGALGVQLVAGIILLLAGGRRPLLHFVYGIIFPVLVLFVAHGVASGTKEEAGAAKVFTAASFFVFGLTLRAFMTGVGLK